MATKIRAYLCSSLLCNWKQILDTHFEEWLKLLLTIHMQKNKRNVKLDSELIDVLKCRDLSSNVKLGGTLPRTLGNLIHLTSL